MSVIIPKIVAMNVLLFKVLIILTIFHKFTEPSIANTFIQFNSITMSVLLPGREDSRSTRPSESHYSNYFHVEPIPATTPFGVFE